MNENETTETECPTCKNKGTIKCFHVDADRWQPDGAEDWCSECDVPADEKFGWITCKTCENW